MQRLVDRPFLLDAMAAAIAAPRTFADYVDDLEAGYAAGAAAHTEPATPLAVRWRGDFDAISSLARINSEVVRRLGDGFTVDIAADDRARADHRAAATGRRRGAPPVAAALRRSGPRPPGADPAVGVRLDPARLGEPLAGVDEVWVPSDFVRDMYVGDGVPADRVHVVPNGVDLETYRPDGPARRLAPDDVCVFLFVGGTIYRKGIDVLLAAFEEAFAGRDDVLLVVKDIGAGTFYSGMNVGDELRRREAAGANVACLSDDLDDEGLAALYRGADVLVHPYRGEGFAMPVLEAMACGRRCSSPAAARPTSSVRPRRRGASRRTASPSRRCCWAISRPARSRGCWSPTARRSCGCCARPPPTVARVRRGVRPAACAARGLRAGRDRRAVRCAPALGRRPARAPLAAAAARRSPCPTGAASTSWPRRPGSAPTGSPTCSSPGGRRSPRTTTWRSTCSPTRRAMATPTPANGACWRPSTRAGGGDGMADIALLEHVAFGADLQRIHDACDAYVPLHDACDGHVRLARAAGSEIVAPVAEAFGGLRSRALRSAA